MKIKIIAIFKYSKQLKENLLKYIGVEHANKIRINRKKRYSKYILFKFEYKNLFGEFNIFQYCQQLLLVKILDVKQNAGLDMSNAFKGCVYLKKVIFFCEIKNVIKTDSMFENCYRLTYLDLEKIDLSNTITADRMFKDCCRLKKIKFDNQGMKKIVSAKYMFSLTSITDINLSINSPNLNDVSFMFEMVMNLKKIDLMFIEKTKNCNVENILICAGKVAIVGRQNFLKVKKNGIGCKFIIKEI